MRKLDKILRGVSGFLDEYAYAVIAHYMWKHRA